MKLEVNWKPKQTKKITNTKKHKNNQKVRPNVVTQNDIRNQLETKKITNTKNTQQVSSVKNKTMQLTQWQSL